MRDVQAQWAELPAVLPPLALSSRSGAGAQEVRGRVGDWLQHDGGG
jgi:hypothetical protein